MKGRSGIRPMHLLVFALVAAPIWKLAEQAWRSRPKSVSASARAEGFALFNHEWTPRDPLTGGDGLGPVFNAKSCVDCHGQGGPGGGGPASKNVTVYGLIQPPKNGLPQVGVVHQNAIRPEFRETLNMVNPGLPRTPSIPLAQLIDKTRPRNPEVVVTQRNTPALFGDGLIDVITEDMIVARQREHSTAARLVGLNGAKDGRVRGRVARLVDGRLGRFGWKSEFSTLDDFVRAACANELGLSNPDRPQATPIGNRDYKPPGVDLTDAQCVLISDYLRALPPPQQVLPADPKARTAVHRGETLFREIGCADCHAPSLGPASSMYSDMLLHDMGVELESSTGYYGAVIPQPTIPNEKFEATEQPVPGEWRTAPLWGVADSAPYLHDGRAGNLDEAIAMHGGEAVDIVARYKELPATDRGAMLAFLKTLRAPGAGEPDLRAEIAAK